MLSALYNFPVIAAQLHLDSSAPFARIYLNIHVGALMI